MGGDDVTVTTHTSDGTKTTTTTTHTKKTHATITVDVGYLVPHGLLKILEMIFCIIVFSLIASVDILYTSDRQSSIVYAPIAFPFAIAIIFFITTFILLIFFMLSLPERACGRRVSNYVDAVHNVFAIVFLFVSFVLLCCYCDYQQYYYSANGKITSRRITVDEIIVAAIFAMAAMILYIISLVFAARSGKIPMITVKS